MPPPEQLELPSDTPWNGDASDSPKNIFVRIGNWLKKDRKQWMSEDSLIASLAVLLGALLLVFLVVMACDELESIYRFMGLSNDEDKKFSALKSLGIAMGGVILAIQAVNSYRRSKGIEKAADAQARAADAQARAVEAQTKAIEQQTAANKNDEGRLRQERLQNGIEHLGHNSSSVRMSGAYELFHLAEETENLRKVVFDILCAHIRLTTGESEYQNDHGSKPSEEIQSLLNLLFVQQEHEVFKGLYVNLAGSWLNYANLTEARLYGADLNSARLQGASLKNARLLGSSLKGAYLQSADLGSAYLQGAVLFEAGLQGAQMEKACLAGSVIGGAGLQGAKIREVQLQGVKYQVDSNSFKERILKSVDKKADINKDEPNNRPIFEGGLGKGDIERLTKGLSDKDARGLKDILLKTHTAERHHFISAEKLENEGINIDAYTQEQAEEWIAEYEAAMAEVPPKKEDAG